MFQTTRIYILILRDDRVFHVLKVIYITEKFEYFIFHHKFNNENETFTKKLYVVGNLSTYTST